MREKRRIGVLDVFIVMLILFGAVGIFLRVRILEIGTAPNAECEVYGRVLNMPSELADCIAVGEILYTADGTPYGTLSEVAVSPAEVRLIENGALITGYDEAGSRIDLQLTVTVMGAESEKGFLRDGRYPVLRGEALALYGERAVFSFVIYDVRQS